MRSAYTTPLPAVMEAVFLWVWGSSLRNFRHGPPSNTPNKLEEEMHAAFLARGRPDLAQAFRRRHKYSRAMRSKLDAEHLWLRREAFLGTEGAGPKAGSEEEWVALAVERYGDDEGFRKYCARLEVEAAEKAEQCAASV